MPSYVKGKNASRPASAGYRYYPAVGEKVKALISKNQVNKFTLSCVLSVLPSFNVAPRTVLDSLKLITAGYLYGRVSSRRELIHPELHLERIAHILYTSGAHSNDETIQAIRKINPSFHYPPAHGISFQEFIHSFPTANLEKNAHKSALFRIERQMCYLGPQEQKEIEHLVDSFYRHHVARVQEIAHQLYAEKAPSVLEKRVREAA